MSFIKPIATAVALTLAAGTALPSVAQAQSRHEMRMERWFDRNARTVERRVYRDERREHRRWHRGERLPGAYHGRVIHDYDRYGLRHPPRGYRWVRADGNYVLIAAVSGIISSIIAAH